MSSLVPDSIDVFVGSQVRIRRMLTGMSQTDLGNRLSVTFQQVQKYEKGKNRISASKLQTIGAVLGVPISYFFENQPEVAGGIVHEGSQGEVNRLQSYLMSKEGLSLNKAFIAIKDPRVRKRVLALAKSLADNDLESSAVHSDVISQLDT